MWNNLLKRLEGVTREYDGFGRMVARHDTRRGVKQRFTYDEEQRISAVELEGDPEWSRAEYRYDALGRRTEKRLWKRHQDRDKDKDTFTQIRYAWSGLQLVGEHDNTRPGAAVQYVYEEGGYQPLARVESQGNAVAGLYWYHGGLNGLPEQVTDEEGRRVWRGVFSAWGRTEQESGGVHWHVAQNLRFQGQYLDRETGLHYNTFRYYDPAGACYTQKDPIGLAGGENLYAYAPDPLTWIDPLGLAKCGTGEYKDVGGHHVHAKAGFKSNPKYDPKKGFSISQDYMDKMGLDHQAMTTYQRQAFKDLYNSGRANTLSEHTRIAVNALEAGGATTQQARSLVTESLWNLRSQGAISPSNIPWYK